MKFAYPQDPSHSLAAIRRYDESSDSATSQSNLERQQDIAVVGETVPMIFCHRFDWGSSKGVNGGVWISPRLIQLGIRTDQLSMMYLLSQGKVTGLQTANTYWGYQKVTDVDSTAQMCYSYESVPSCLDLDYDPGGSLSWTETVRRTGPGINQNNFSYQTSTDKTIKISFTFSSSMIARYSGDITCGGDWAVDWINTCRSEYGSNCAGGPSTNCDIAAAGNAYTVSIGGSGSSYNGDKYRGKGLNVFQYQNSNQYDRTSCGGWWVRYYYWRATTAGISGNASGLYWTTGVQYDWTVIDNSTGTSVKSGTQWIDHGNSSLTIDGLPAGDYTVNFTQRSVGWNSGQPCLVSRNENMVSQVAAYNNRSMGFSRSAYGSASVSGTTAVVETVYNRIDFPELPGGDQQIVGGLSDLTMLGIAGTINNLRPVDGPDYFIQSHLFVESGIQVERMTWGGVGSSPFYGDLVHYLMNSSQVLKPEQIDRDSIVVANNLNTAYRLYFNGVLQTTNSLAEWMTRTAPYFLLTPRQIDGKYGLWPVCPVNSANELSRDRTVPVLTVTRDDIVQGSYGRSYISVKDRRPVCLVMVYRDQPSQSVGQTVTVEVRYPGTALSGPFESHDLTEFACTSEQAVYAARYILSKRRYTTHTVSFTMARRAAQLKPGDIIKVDLALDTTDGAGITDVIFYQIESLAEGQGGSVAIEATHFPTFGDDVSVVAYETHEGRVSIV